MLLAAAACLPAGAAGAPDMPPGADIPSVVVDGGSITVSGLSSGAFQAVQMHYAFSLTIKGAGVLAGGPFWCAQDDVLVATSSCMTSPGDIDLEYLAGVAENTALWGFIDPLSGLKDSRVWLFSGINDSVVNQGVVKAAASMYAQVLGDAESQMSLTTNLPGEHAQQTLHYGNTCEYLGEPFINMCGVDAAGDMLQWLYPGQLSPPATNVSAAMGRAAFGLPAGENATQDLADATVLCALDVAAVPMGRGTWQVAPLPECPADVKALVESHAAAAADAASVAGPTGGALKVAPTPVLRAGNGTLYTFDQGLFIGGGGWSTDVGLAQMAFVFIPDACLASNSGAAPASGCILHMAFHGCEQTVDDIGAWRGLWRYLCRVRGRASSGAHSERQPGVLITCRLPPIVRFSSALHITF